MTNPFQGRAASLTGPALDIVTVTPDDNTDLASAGMAFYATTPGNVAVVTVTGATRTVPVAEYMIVPVGIVRVLATGTTASGIQVFTLS